jgi:hypothetical protein
MTDTARVATTPNKGLWGALLLLSLLWIGFTLGMMIGGRFFVPPGSGLAGPAIAFVYGVGGTVVGGVLAVLLLWRLPPRLLRASAATAGAIGVAVAVVIVVLMVAKQAAAG